MKDVPFFANTADGTHCVQACFRSMLKYFVPERDFSWTELDKLTHKLPRKGTWWFQMVLQFKKLGLKTKFIEYFDYERYWKEGNDYISGIFSPEVAEYHLHRSNLPDVKHLIPEFLRQTGFKPRPATIEDIDKLLANGWLMAIDINSRTLNNRSGYSGHAVVVYKKEGQNYLIHDPGLPPNPSRKVTRKKLLEAWQYAGKNNTSLIAV